MSGTPAIHNPTPSMKTLNEVISKKPNPPDPRIQKERIGDSQLAQEARIALLSDYRTHKSTSIR